MTTASPGQRATSQGAAVRAALEAHDGFRSAQDVHAALREGGSRIGLSTVYRHLQALTDAGVVDAIQHPDGETTYRFCGRDRHHHHLVCRSCGRAEEVEGRAVERWAAEVARRAGYVQVDHTVELFGLCPACAEGGSPPATQ